MAPVIQDLRSYSPSEINTLDILHFKQIQVIKANYQWTPTATDNYSNDQWTSTATDTTPMTSGLPQPLMIIMTSWNPYIKGLILPFNITADSILPNEQAYISIQST